MSDQHPNRFSNPEYMTALDKLAPYAGRIEELELNLRLKAVLHNGVFREVTQDGGGRKSIQPVNFILELVRLTESDVLRFLGMGRKGLNEINAKLADKNLKLDTKIDLSEASAALALGDECAALGVAGLLQMVASDLTAARDMGRLSPPAELVEQPLGDEGVSSLGEIARDPAKRPLLDGFANASEELVEARAKLAAAKKAVKDAQRAVEAARSALGSGTNLATAAAAARCDHALLRRVIAKAQDLD